MNRVLEKFQRGEKSVGTFTHMKSTVAIEAMGYTGLDYVLIDSEHFAVDGDFIGSAITAADAAGITPFVRIKDCTRPSVLRPLDLGAKGLIVPAVESVEEVRSLIEYAKFAPLGNRGFCPTRDGGWGFDEASQQGGTAYMERSNRETMLIPQCETAGALEHIEEIAALDGVDGIFVGPNDLSIALGCPLQMDAPAMREALTRILAACNKNGKPALIFSGNAAAAKENLAAGFDSVTVGLDVMALIQSYRNLIGEICD